MTCLPGRVAHSINKIMPVWLMTWHEWWCIVLTYEQWCIVLTWTIIWAMMHCLDMNNHMSNDALSWHEQSCIVMTWTMMLCLDGVAECIANHALAWYSTYLSTTMYEWVHVTVQSDMPASDCIIMPCLDILYSYIPALQCIIDVSHSGPITHSIYAYNPLYLCTIVVLHNICIASSTCTHGCIQSIYMAASTM